VIVNVEWPQRTADQLTTRVISNATLEVSSQLALRADGSVAEVTSTTRTLDATKPADHRQLGPGVVWWSDRTPSSLEQIVLRARAIGGNHASVSLVATSKDVPAIAEVERVDDDNGSIALGIRR
jgi:hypothetical protein